MCDHTEVIHLLSSPRTAKRILISGQNCAIFAATSPVWIASSYVGDKHSTWKQSSFTCCHMCLRWRMSRIGLTSHIHWQKDINLTTSCWHNKLAAGSFVLFTSDISTVCDHLSTRWIFWVNQVLLAAHRIVTL